jgi:hypothetical protein
MYRAFTLIHEFAHELGVPRFRPEGGLGDYIQSMIEKDNNSQILKNCEKTLSGFDNGML